MDSPSPPMMRASDLNRMVPMHQAIALAAFSKHFGPLELKEKVKPIFGAALTAVDGSHTVGLVDVSDEVLRNFRPLVQIDADLFIAATNALIDMLDAQEPRDWRKRYDEDEDSGRSPITIALRPRADEPVVVMGAGLKHGIIIAPRLNPDLETTESKLAKSVADLWVRYRHRLDDLPPPIAQWLQGAKVLLDLPDEEEVAAVPTASAPGVQG